MDADLDRRQAADALGLSPAQFRERAEDPSCPLGEGVKRGRRVYWSRDAVEATRLWQAARSKAPQKPARDRKKTKTATPTAPTQVNVARTDDANANSAPKADMSSTAAAPRQAKSVNGVAPHDPITLWLEACQTAAALFQQSCDPRRALLLMNPFAPFAAYAAFAQPPFTLPGFRGPSAGGLGVWGAHSGPGALNIPSPRRAAGGSSRIKPPRRAEDEARKLHKCALPPSERR